MKKFFIIFLEGAIFAMTLSGCKTDTEILSESMDSGVSEQQMFNESISTDMSNLFDYSQYEKEHFTITIERINNQTAYQNLIKKTAETKPLLDQYLAYFHHPLMSSSLTIMQYDEKFPIDCLRKIDEQHVYCIQKTDTGGLLYSFFDGVIQKDTGSLCLSHSIYSIKPLYKNDFDSINIGDSMTKVEK